MNIKKIFAIGVLFVVFINLFSQSVFSQTENTQDNPLLIPHTLNPPKVDGIGDDLCWQNVKWQSMNQVWIPWNGTLNSSSYTGRFKVVWSSATNLLYFLMEVFDDVIVQGYTAHNGTCYNYDISEVFIDENRSGGEHRYDSPTTNAQNAFAYHMYCDYPADGQVITTPYIEDMAGTQAASKWVERTSHFPEFALRKNGNTYTREFSLIVYNDTYTDANKDAARVKLQVGKVMGLSVAYCDNDHPNRIPITRDNMYGSVTEPSPGNLHWMNADYFGKVILASDTGTDINNEKKIPGEFELVQNYPNPFNPSTTIQYKIPAVDALSAAEVHVSLKVYDVLGREVATLVNEYKQPGSYNTIFNTSHLESGFTVGGRSRELSSGVYFFTLRTENFLSTKKMVLMK